MSRFFRTLLLFAFLAPVTTATAAPFFSGKKVSTTRDEWGHRPGARGFSTVILDAGHGGHDSGATSSVTKQREKDLTLDMVERVRRELGGSVRTIITRGSDTFIDLDDRVRFANRYNDAVLVSLHFNFGPANLAGPEVYYWRVDSYTLAKRIFSALSQATEEKHANRGLVRRRLRLTRNPQLPSVLVECGYLTHGSEARLIAKPEYRAKLAKAIARAILDQRAEGDGNLGPLPKPLNEPLSKASDKRE